MSDGNKIKFLWQAAASLNPSSHTNRLLKSEYLTICRKIAWNKVHLPPDKFAENAMCKKCSICWSDTNYSLKLKPQSIRSAKAKKLVEALQQGENLTRKQKNRAKWYRKKINSYMEYLCGLCQQTTKVPLIKPKIKTEKKEEIQPISKKKKKQGHKICPVNVASGSTTKTKSQKQAKLLNFNKTAKTKKQQPKTTIQMVSATQQKNSLLQLAQILKSASKSDATKNKSNDRLKNLLK